MVDPLPSRVFALGFSLRKRRYVREFFSSTQISFVSRLSQVPKNGTVLVWASGIYGTHAAADKFDFASISPRRLFVEDGFLRSVGLGADLVRPVSWVVDSRGIYYDARRPSDLEQILQFEHFDESILQRAVELRKRLIATGLTKYNVGHKFWSRPLQSEKREIVLVPGQVESDASISLGTAVIKTNLELLQAARIAHPDSWLIYKPHPDVVAGLRGKGAGEDVVSRWCDEIVTDVSMGPLLEVVDVVHVLTSLAGFEALLRGKQVICHGMPFYAGWGLTKDMLECSRRTRKLVLDQLIAGVLLKYPRYVSRVNGELCSAEVALAELQAWKTGSKSDLPFWRKMLRPLLKHS